ncbi:glycosyltransferase family 2 protein [Acidobacteriota bacterium]
MASYNHEQFIAETIESVLNQTFADFELNIVDDGSLDNSKEIINKYAELDPRIRFVFHEKNEGIARTYNDGLDMARGRYIALVASDDIWNKVKLQKQLDIMNKNENLVVWSEAAIIDSKGKYTGRLFTEMVGAIRRKKSGDIFEELVRGNYLCAHIFAKKEYFQTLRFDEDLKYLNDYKLLLELANNCRFHFLSEPLVRYRIHKGNTINSDAVNWRKDMIKLGEEILQKYDHKISNRSKAKVFLTISAANSKLGNVSESRKNLYKAIKLNPFEWFYNTFLVRYLRKTLFSLGLIRNKYKRNTKSFTEQ